MAASKVKELLDELAATLAELGMLDEQEPEEVETAMEGDENKAEGERSAVDAIEARQAKYDSLLAKAERIKSAIAKAEAAEARKAELLKVLHRAAPVETTDVKTRIEPVSTRGYKPGVFESPEVAHRCEPRSRHAQHVPWPAGRVGAQDDCSPHHGNYRGLRWRPVAGWHHGDEV